MRFGILGSLELLDERGAPVALGGPREQVVLGALLLEANRVVPVDRLIEAVWGDDPPGTASNALQGIVSKLRKTLHAAGADDRLRTRPPGYVLDLSPGELDAEQFVMLVTETDPETGGAGDPETVERRMGAAIDLWRGPVLDGLDVGATARATVSRFEGLRESAIERKLDAGLDLGRHRELLGELEALVRTDPLSERFRGQLMVALYRSGRQADALAAYGELRELLTAELGIDPSPAIQALELDILNHAPHLQAPQPAGPAGPAGRREPGPSTAGPAPSDPIPLPARLAAQPPVGIVGREAELRAVAAAVKRVTAGGGREVVLVAGEAGLGKTTLVAAAARAAGEAGAGVLFGHCEEDLARSYQLFAESLGHLVARAPLAQLTAHVEAHGSELARLVPSLGDRVPDLPPSRATDVETERYLLFAAVVGLLADTAAGRPVVLVLDDLQWADSASLLLLRQLMAADQVDRLLVLATYRSNELVHTDALRDTLGALRRHCAVERIDLVGLNDDEVVSYFEAAAGQTLDPAGVRLAHAVYRETDGNPFFVGEVLRHLTETGAIERNEDGRWIGSEDLEATMLPDSVREVVGGRVVRLGKEAGRLLSLAAVIGRDFDLELLSDASGNALDDVLDLLDDATAAALVTELSGTPGRYQFTHALIQRTLYEDLGPTRQARAHRQIAEALERLPADHGEPRVRELARHWVEAIQPVDLAKAITYSQQAGASALKALSPGEAVRYFTQALDLSAQGTDRDPAFELDTRIGLGTAMRQAGDPGFREMLLRAARDALALDDTDRLASAALENNRGTFSTVSAIDEDKVAILETAIGRLDADDPRRAPLLAALCTELTVDSPLERRQALADEAIALADRHGDAVTLLKVLNLVNLPLAVPHMLGVNLERTTRALAVAKEVDDPLLLCLAASGRRLIAGCVGDVEEMDRCSELRAPLVARLDLPFLSWVNTLQLAMRAVIAGDADEAERLALQALQLGNDSGQPDAAIVFGTQLVMVNLVRGTMGTLVPLLEQAVADNPGLPTFAAVLALAHAEAGRTGEVRRIFEQFAPTRFRIPLDIAWLTGMIALADAAVVLHDPDVAAPIVEQLEPFADQWLHTDIATSGPVGRSVGALQSVLGRFGEADGHFGRAAASCERTGARFFGAQTDLAWGSMLVVRGRPGDAERSRELLLRARTVAAAHGYATVERRAAAGLEGKAGPG